MDQDQPELTFLNRKFVNFSALAAVCVTLIAILYCAAAGHHHQQNASAFQAALAAHDTTYVLKTDSGDSLLPFLGIQMQVAEIDDQDRPPVEDNGTLISVGDEESISGKDLSKGTTITVIGRATEPDYRWLVDFENSGMKVHAFMTTDALDEVVKVRDAILSNGASSPLTRELQSVKPLAN